MLKETLHKTIVTQLAELPRQPIGIERDIANSIDLSLPHALTITGIRRCGKSTLLRQLMTPLSAYCNFEDPNLIDFSVKDFARLEEIFEQVRPAFDLCAFDEIQNIPDWERYVRRAPHKFLVTGSNASLLSRELGTKLTGRHLSIELFPFSYIEMLTLTKQTPGLESFRQYTQNGGFPEFLLYERLEILQELFRDILARDIAVRHGVRDIHALKELALYLISNVGSEFSFSNLAKLYGFGSENTVAAYISYMEDCYLLFTIPRFAFSLKRQRRNPKKVYAIDTGFCRANSVTFSSNKGRALENIVFLELRRRGGEIYYFKEDRECDFVVRKNGQIETVIQVCHELHDDNLKRETEGLREAMNATGCPHGLILTENQEDLLDQIQIQPTWKWLSEDRTKTKN